MPLRLMLTLVAALAILALSGCSGYRAALVPMDPPPTVKESLTTEKGSGLLTPDDAAPTWKKIVFWGTVGH